MIATETPCTPNHSHNKGKDLDEELSRSDVSVEKSRGDDENAVFEMTPSSTSSTRKRQRRINFDDEDEIDRKTSITESVEDETISSSPEIVRSSSKKGKHVLYSSDSEDSGEESLGVTPGFNALKGRGTAVRRVKKNLDEAFGKNEAEDDTPRNVWSPEGNNCTANIKKAKKEKALEALRKKRERQAGGLSGELSPLFNDDNSEGSVSPKSIMEEEEEADESESDMDDFVVEDSQSQELPVIAKLELDEAYKRLVQMSLSSILDKTFLSSLKDKPDPYFDEAEASIEKAVESKKNLVASTTWNQFKKMLESCSVLKSQAIMPMIRRAKCQEFSVGCYCAERGSLYHDLHHHNSQLKESCIEKINKVREAMGTESDEAMGTESDNNIVEFCINDEEWLDMLFKTFKALLTKAEEWAEDGGKRKQMKAYCASFH